LIRNFVRAVIASGGQLVVRSGAKETTFDWSKASATSAVTKVQWAAFYSDCEHEVYEVTAGHRLTLTYNLFAARGCGTLAGYPDSALDPTRLPLYDTLKAALNTPGFFSNGRVIGVHLAHKYAHTLPGAHFLPHSLKGADMVPYEVARALGMVCALRPVMEEEYSDYDYESQGRLCDLAQPTFGALDYSNRECEGSEDIIEEIRGGGWDDLEADKLTWLETANSANWEPAMVCIAV
jgi:hypothetical protein